MVERDHRVSLPAAEVRLQVDDRYARATGDPLRRLRQQLPKAHGQVGAPEELDGLRVLSEALAKVHLMEVGRELGEGELALCDVVVGLDDVPPRPKPRRGLREERIGLRSGLLRLGFEPLAHQFALCGPDLGCAPERRSRVRSRSIVSRAR